MTQSAARPARIPVNATGLKERMLVRTALADHDAQLRNFTPLRDRFMASGQDANAKYREIQAERDQLWAKWKTLAPTASPEPFPVRPGGAVSSLPIAGLKLIGPGGQGSWFGYSGSVMMGPAQEGENQIPQGAEGSISTIPNGLLSNGSILFTDYLTTSGEAAIWLHNWKNLIVFPDPVVPSSFTYSFGVGVQVSLLIYYGSATFLSFIALGETANFKGQEITVNNDGYPLVTNLVSPCAPTTIRGVLNVQRSFPVGAGEVPAIALTAGVATALSTYSQFIFDDNGGCFICPAASIDPATAEGPERGVVNFHYQPLPLENL